MLDAGEEARRWWSGEETEYTSVRRIIMPWDLDPAFT
jgi:hypothetical protein